MTVNYTEKNGRFTFATDRTKPKPRGKFIAGWKPSLDLVGKAVARYLGNDDFKLVDSKGISLENSAF